MKKLSIIIVALLFATICYSFIDFQGNTHPNLGYLVALLAKFLKILSLGLVLLFVSNSFKSIRKYNLLNYISVLSVILLLLSELSLDINFIAYKIQAIYMLVYVISGVLETFVICLILISLFVIKSNRQEVSSNQASQS
ncbi:hypothetical protein GCM10017706_19110 [Lactococcus lactis subsp. hordniae]